MAAENWLNWRNQAITLTSDGIPPRKSLLTNEFDDGVP
jgi:hypothetical protein